MLGHELHCVWDAKEIPEDRARKGAITCCEECKRLEKTDDAFLKEQAAITTGELKK